MGNLTMCSYGDVGGNMSEQRGRDSGIDRGSGPTFPPGRRMRPIAKVKVIWVSSPYIPIMFCNGPIREQEEPYAIGCIL